MAHFYHEMTLTTYSISQKHGSDAAAKYYEASFRFIVDYYRTRGSIAFPAPNPDLVISADALWITVLQALATECFVLAHEIGHLVAGHLDARANTNMIALEGSQTNVEFYTKSQEQELQADAIGSYLYQCTSGSIELVKALSAPVRAAAPFEFFQLTKLVEGNLGTSEERFTHPPTWIRVANLLLSMKEQGIDDASYAYAAEVARLAITMPTLASGSASR